MLGIDREVAKHFILTDPRIRPIKQKFRLLSPEWAQKIKEEVNKQIEVGFLEEVDYPKWLANIVHVLKKDGRVRMCVNYRDMNKATLKDDFSLPHIDVLIDSTVGKKYYTCANGMT